MEPRPLTRQALDGILISRDPVNRLEHLRMNGVLRLMFPEVQKMVGFGGGDTGHKDLWEHTKRVVAQTILVPIVRWAALFHDVGKVRCFTVIEGKVSFHGHEAYSARLFKQAARRTALFTDQEEEDIRFLIEHLGHVEEYDSSWSDSAVRRLHKLAGGHFDNLLALSRADITTKHADKRQKHYERIKELRDRALEIARVDAIPKALPTGLGAALSAAFGIPPSPALGELMQKIRASVEAGELERQAEIDAIVQFVRDRKLV